MLTFSMIIGFIRLMLIVFLLFFIHKRILRYHYPKDIVSYIIKKWVIYISSVVVLIFLLLHLNSYDLFTFLLLMIASILLFFFEIKHLKSIFKDFERRIKMLLITLIRNKESKNKVFRLNKTEKEREDKKGKRNAIVIAFLAVFAMLTRSLFASNDIYLLSDVWVVDLEKIKAITNQNWFFPYLYAGGEHAIINFYSKLVGVSPEVALQSFGIIEIGLVVITIYWFTSKLSQFSLIPPIFATLFFILLPFLLPVNTTTFTEHKPTFFALSIAIPIMVFIINPKKLVNDLRHYFLLMLLFFASLFLIDLFVVALMLPYFIVVVFFIKKKHIRFLLNAVLAYCISGTFILGIYAILCYRLQVKFLTFLSKNTHSVHSFTEINAVDLLNKYQLLSMLCIIPILFLVKHKNYWRYPLMFIIYFNVLLLINSLNILWIDKDLLNLVFTVFIPILIGVMVSLILKVITQNIANRINLGTKTKYAIVSLFLFISVLFYILKPQKISFKTHTYNKEHVKSVLGAYEKISQDYLPYSFAVVNGYPSYVIDKNRNYSIPYNEFNTSYLKKDSIYHANKHNKTLLKEHPEYVLPNSILVFYHHLDRITEEDVLFSVNTDIIELDKKLKVLKQRGRNITVVFKSKTLTVFEIINKPNSSRIENLLF